MVQIGDYKYSVDDFGSIHQIIDEKSYFKKLDFYTHNIYVDGKFHDQPKKLDELKMLQSIEVDRLEMNSKFEILEEWGFKDSPFKMLDLGCSYGLFISEWNKKGYGDGYGYDISNFAKPVSKFINENLNIYSLDINNIQARHIYKTTRVICAFDFIEHLLDVDSFLNRLIALHSSFEYFIIEIPIIPKLKNYEKIVDYKYLHPKHHVHLYTTAGIINALNKIGFKLLGIESLKSNLKNILLFKNARIS